MPVLTLIDASGFAFRAFYGLPPLSTKAGVPTHAVLGFTRILLKVIRQRKPTHLALCFDKSGRLGRQEIDPNYKANRGGQPIGIMDQFVLIRRVADALNIPMYDYEGWEADDVIATLATQAVAQGWEAELIVSDKDFLQLACPQITIYDPAKDVMLDAAWCLNRYGIHPTLICDYLALAGDAVDNVPKVPGVGDKTAAALVNQFGSVENLILNLDKVAKPKIQESLRQHVDQIKRAKRLVTFKSDLAVGGNLEMLVRQPLDVNATRALFLELEFAALAKDLLDGKP